MRLMIGALSNFIKPSLLMISGYSGPPSLYYVHIIAGQAWLTVKSMPFLQLLLLTATNMRSFSDSTRVILLQLYPSFDFTVVVPRCAPVLVGRQK